MTATAGASGAQHQTGALTAVEHDGHRFCTTETDAGLMAGMVMNGGDVLLLVLMEHVRLVVMVVHRGQRALSRVLASVMLLVVVEVLLLLLFVVGVVLT